MKGIEDLLEEQYEIDTDEHADEAYRFAQEMEYRRELDKWGEIEQAIEEASKEGIINAKNEKA